MNKLSYNELEEKVVRLEEELRNIKQFENQKSYSELIAELNELKQKNKKLSEFEIKLPEQNDETIIENNSTEGINAQEFRIIEHFYYGVYVLKLEGSPASKILRLIYANPASELITGVKKDDIINKTIRESFPEFEKNGIIKLLDKVIKTRKSSELKEIYYSNENTGPRFFSVKAFPLSKNYFGISFENITKRKSIQNALKESEGRFRSILNNANSVIYLKDLTGRYLLVNKQFEVLFRQNNIEVIGKSDYDIFPKEYADKIVNSDTDVINNKTTLSIEEIVPVNGNSYTLLSSKFPIYDNEKNIFAICCISTDITDRKKAEDELSKIFNLSTDLICITTLDGHFLKVNPAFERVLGYSQEGFLKKSLFDFLHPDDIKRTIDTVNEKIKNNVNTIMLENRYRCKDGSYKWFSWISQPLVDKNIAFSIARDITTQKFYEKELIRAKEKAEESDRLKTAFLANMSHEIRTPMNGILGFTKMIDNKGLSDEKRKQFIEYIHSSGNQLLTIINDIIDISKIEAGQLKFIKSDVNLNKLIDDLFTRFESEKSAQNISDLKLQCSKGFSNDKSFIFIDEARLKQVISNLLYNAIKFTDKGIVQFGYKLKDNSNLLFYVKDTGIGISKDKQNIIFERFRQEDESFTRKFGGTGLGLAISKSIIELMGGQIWVDSRKNKGAAFYILLPYEPSKIVCENSNLYNAEMEYNWKDKTILVVEDDLMGSEYLKEIMEHTQINILLAENGIDGIEMCKNKPEINVILMDLRLPKMDGYTAITEIRKIRPKIPIIVQTANAMPEDKLRAEKAGSNDFLTKPLNRIELLKTINNFF